MTTDAIEDILKDNTIDHDKKFNILKQANLSYSKIFKLQEIFKYDNEIYTMLSYFTFYRDNRLDTKVNLQNKINHSNAMKKRKRRKRYDKHKRR